MRIWFKMFENTHLLKDMTVTNETDEVCYAFDLGKPIWLDKNVNEFKRHAKTRFTKDNFVEEIEFDFLEMEVIEED